MSGPAGAPLSRGNHLAAVAFCRATKSIPAVARAAQPEDPMTERDFEAKLAELDRLLNDPEVRMDPDRVWTILAEISGKDAGVPVRA
jgi:hypothetical protein